MNLIRTQSSVRLVFLCLTGLFVYTETVRDSDVVCAPLGSDLLLNSICNWPSASTQNITGHWQHSLYNETKLIKKSSHYKLSRNDSHRICSLTIMDLNKTDTGTYSYSLIQTFDKASTTVFVTDLQVVVGADRVTEGQTVTLTCDTSCPPASKHSFIWYKNSRRLDVQHSGDELQVGAISSEDTDRYSCALKQYETFPSAERELKVYVKFKSVGVITLSSLFTLLTLLVCAAVWRIRKKCKCPEVKETNTQNDAVYSNVSTLAEDRDESDHKDAVQYSHVHFTKRTNVQPPAASAEEADVQYAAITVSERTAAPY